MAKFIVTVKYSFEKDLTIYADDEDEAQERACDIVLGWNNVVDAEATDVEEE